MSDFENMSDDDLPKNEPKMTCETARVLSEQNRLRLEEELQTRLLDECEEFIAGAVVQGKHYVDCPRHVTQESLEKRFGPRGFHIVPITHNFYSQWKIVFQPPPPPPPSLGQRLMSLFTPSKEKQ